MQIAFEKDDAESSIAKSPYEDLPSQQKCSLHDAVVEEPAGNGVPIPSTRDIHARIQQYCNNRQSNNKIKNKTIMRRQIRKREKLKSFNHVRTFLQ